MPMTLDALCAIMGLDTRPVAIYDAPDPSRFAPLAEAKRCLFDHYDDWQRGETIDITPATAKCPGCSYWLTDTGKFPSREVFVNFLTVKEGVRESAALTNAWLDANPAYRPEHGHLLVGPVQLALAEYLKTVTFFVTPDQLSVLMWGAFHHAHPDDPAPVTAPFGSGCGLMLSLFPSLSVPQALIGATDIAMRWLLPPDRLAFTVTVPMLDRLLSLDIEQSFLGKHFLKKLKAARESTSLSQR
ncbi:hypothetical protein GMST_02010 [Geomonas silvestris]|uniref:Uncharacterized protein n=1 Tax=Geomonas silvestris TaxID=2740184 RepID=A0A6V8MD57_9BACT|nr:DUF169 domain-containing protein [Geomonas silvestris]GFO57876.1 hypothetical protein GMST_02010 [Geomonas silvestris]